MSQSNALDLCILREIKVTLNLSIRRVSIGWNLPYYKDMDKLLLLFLFLLDYVEENVEDY